MRKIILDIGCGEKKHKNAIGIDIRKTSVVDVISDLSHFPWPFRTSSVDEVYCYHFLEHFSETEKILQEIHRICKRDAVLHILVPHVSYEGAFRDPSHKSFFTYRSFEYFGNSSDLPNYFDFKFEIVERKLIFDRIVKNPINIIMRKIANKNPNFYESKLMWIFPCNTIYVKMKVVK